MSDGIFKRFCTAVNEIADKMVEADGVNAELRDAVLSLEEAQNGTICAQEEGCDTRHVKQEFNPESDEGIEIISKAQTRYDIARTIFDTRHDAHTPPSF